ncbi:hypothetical protein IAU60_003201 [Kwoniella sp. DSM 27419]
MSQAQLEQLIQNANIIVNMCPAGVSRPLAAVGRLPELRTPSRISMVPADLAEAMDKDTLQSVRQYIDTFMEQDRAKVRKAYLKTLAEFHSLEDAVGITDHALEDQLCRLFESLYQSHCEQLKDKARRALLQRYMVSDGCRPKRPSSFAAHTVNVLESAYAQCQALTPAETELIARAGGINAHQVRTWFQNKRNRGKKGASKAAGRQVASLPKRAQVSRPEPKPEPLFSQPRRAVRALPKRAQQTSHNAPNASIAEVSLGTCPSDLSNVISSTFENANFGMERSPSLISNASSDVPNGGFISPYDMHIPQTASPGEAQQTPQISVEWGTGMLNVPLDALGGAAAPVFNFTPPSPLKVDFSSMFQPDLSTSPVDMSSFADIDWSAAGLNPHLDMASGLESIESLLTEALNNPSSFDNLGTLAASPQFSLGSLSPRSSSSGSLREFFAGDVTPDQLLGAPSESNNPEGDFFNALESLLASPANELPDHFGPEQVPVEKHWDMPRSMSICSDISFSGFDIGTTTPPAAISNATSTIAVPDMTPIGAQVPMDDLSYIASIPLPPSPTLSACSLPDMMSAGGLGPVSRTDSSPIRSRSSAPSPHVQAETEWAWIGGALPFDHTAGMELDGDMDMDIHTWIGEDYSGVMAM